MPHSTQAWESHQKGPGLAVDQRSRGEAYISFSQPNPNHSIDKEHQGKNSKNTSRTARTGEQQELLHLFQQPPETNQDSQACKEEQGKQTKSTRSNPLHQQLILGAGVRYTLMNMSKPKFCS
jgi:hypothetical protein